MFTGREYDSEIGLYFYRARYYDPAIGRFIQEDPIGFQGGDTNLYAYVRNNPVKYRDPLGLEFITPKEGEHIVSVGKDWVKEEVPYLLGGRTKKGADCSGATSSIYKEAGFPYQHVSTREFPEEHFRLVTGIPQIGDIVLWEGHMAIYAGDNQVLSARREGFKYGLYPEEWFGKEKSYYRYYRPEENNVWTSLKLVWDKIKDLIYK